MSRGRRRCSARKIACGVARPGGGGGGREAILARERRDHDRAIELLDAVLADESTSERERGGAELLRGLEALRVDDHAKAAAHFHAARSCPALAPVEGPLAAL